MSCSGPLLMGAPTGGIWVLSAPTMAARPFPPVLVPPCTPLRRRFTVTGVKPETTLKEEQVSTGATSLSRGWLIPVDLEDREMQEPSLEVVEGVLRP